MPELAEAALYCSDITKKTKGAKLASVEYGEDKWVDTIVPTAVREKLEAMIDHEISFRSFGKTIGVSASQGRGFITIKLGMTGRFQDFAVPEAQKRHVFLTLTWSNGITVRYVDFRRFGRMNSGQWSENWIGRYIPTHGFQIRDWHGMQMVAAQTANCKVPRITWLLKHGVDTGVGNYMANEALGRLNLSPFEPLSGLAEACKLLQACGEIAQDSFKAGGNSFAGGYYRLNGDPGAYESQCRFYRSPTVPRTEFRGRPVYSNFQAPKNLDDKTLATNS